MPIPPSSTSCPATAARNFHRAVVRLTHKLLADDQTVRDNALFHFREFAPPRFRRAVVRQLVLMWVAASGDRCELITAVLRKLRRDVVDHLHRRLTRRQLPPEAVSLIELMAAVIGRSRYQAGLMWELAGHPQADEVVKEAARLAHAQLQ